MCGAIAEGILQPTAAQDPGLTDAATLALLDFDVLNVRLRS